MGVEVEASGPFTMSLALDRLVSVDVRPSVADGLTGRLDPAAITLDIVRRVVDEILVVDEDDLRRATASPSCAPAVPRPRGSRRRAC
jgi:threonine dehydratase